MSNHSKTLVPIEVWAYNSPELKIKNMNSDVGLFIESLLYYDEVLLNISNPKVFADLLSWFVKQNSFKDLLNLFNDGIVKIYDYSFISTAVDVGGKYSLYNIQDEVQSIPGTYEQRILYSKEIEQCLPHARHRAALFKALERNILEVKAINFDSAIENAKDDLLKVEKHNILLQSFLNHIYKIKNLGQPPEIKTTITPNSNVDTNVSYNFNLEKLEQKIGREIGFHKATPLTAMANANRLIQSASEEMCDLYLGSPISTLVGNKIEECNSKIIKIPDIIERLKIEVEYPDIRSLINNNQIDFQKILTIREKAQKFRKWLQTEGERDRNAIIAYHNEVGKEIGWSNSTVKIVNIFSIAGGAIIGNQIGGLEGSIAGSTASYLAGIVTKIKGGWKPIIFGEWLENKVKHD